MPNKTWKTAERRIAAYWPGGERRGPDTSARKEKGKGLPDVRNVEGWSIEIKHRTASPTFGLMVKAVEQAERNKINPTDIPVAVMHKKGMDYKDSLVIMTLENFRDFFINE